MGKILVLNAGSSSVKFAIYAKQKCILEGEVEEIGAKQSLIWMKGEINFKRSLFFANHSSAVKWILNHIDGIEIDGIGHRVVFGGEIYKHPKKVSATVVKRLKDFKPFASLHLPIEIQIIETTMKQLKKIPQVACFDTSFHHTIPTNAKILPIPHSYFKQGIHKFGFHGISYEYIASKVKEKKVVAAHLGSGCSICAIKDGKSLDTTMGLTPLGGIIMGTRPGDLDPGVLLYLLKEKKFTKAQLQEFLNHSCGLKGLASTNDMKKLLKAKDAKSKLAIETFCYSIAKQIGAYSVSLGGLDALVFSGGIGERSYEIREKVCSYLSFLGVKIQNSSNKANKAIISSSLSDAKVHIVKTQEELIIAKATIKLLNM